MKTCLNCKKEYQHKREASKFCSDKCRVAYNRKHPRQAVSTVQMQVLYNAVLELLGNAGKIQQTAPIAPKTTYQAAASRATSQISTQDLMRKYVEERRDFTCEEEYREWLRRLQDDNRLTNKQKELIINTH